MSKESHCAANLIAEVQEVQVRADLADSQGFLDFEQIF
jgi:hypothetical protein